MNTSPSTSEVDIDEILIADLDLRIAKLTEEVQLLQERKRALENARGYKGLFPEDIKSRLDYRPLADSEIKDKTQRDILKLIAHRNHLWLVVQHAVKLMVDAHVLQPDNASAQIYTLLAKSKEDFDYILPGIYRLRGTAKKPLLADNKRPNKPTLKESATTTKSGLVEKVAEMRMTHPDWSIKQVTEELVRQHWDFGGKTPIFSVGISFANLARQAKRGKEVQPRLPV